MLDTIDNLIRPLDELRNRNETLFFFGIFCFAVAAACLLLINTTSTKVAGVNAWYKPLKFALSIGIYTWTMAWYCHYLSSFNITFFDWANILLFSFELAYITLQAARGQESHFNQSSILYRGLFVGMAIAATLIVLYAGYVGWQFFKSHIQELPAHYLWSIRLAIVIFVIFSLEGFLMGSRQTHSVGANTSSSVLPVTQWNLTSGDLRVAHFVGMHALQIIPILSFYVVKNTIAVFVISALYMLLAFFALYQALDGRPVIGFR